jgi:23S rRNA (adenine2503-C2)-methyltransferase
VGCTFCGTGKFFIRNLTANEIVQQVYKCLETIDCDPNEIEKFQIMFMSMGEPFLCDSEQLYHAIRRLHAEYPTADLLISTSAPQSMINKLPEFIRLCQEIPKIGLQFSIHESTNEARAKLIPTKTSTLRQIAAMGEMWAAYTGRVPFFNYCVHEGNSSKEDAENLAYLFNPHVWEVTLSVICEKEESVQSSMDRQLEIIKKFSDYMLFEGYSIRVFNPAGQDDIGGGCGQLWYVQSWMETHSDLVHKSIGSGMKIVHAPKA